MYDPQALADAETHLIHVLETSNPPRDASGFKITEAAQDYHDTTGAVCMTLRAHNHI